jgi:hypothetical protein
MNKISWSITYSWKLDFSFEKYKNIENIVSIREAEDSKMLWNRVIKIDFINKYKKWKEKLV